MANSKLTDKQKEQVKDLWLAGHSYLSLGRQFSVSKSTVSKALDKYNISPQMRAERMIHRGQQSGRWKGGRMIDINGYVKVTVQPDSLCYPARDANNRVYEHRLVMAEHIGRPLLPHENVHHKNGDRQDNRIDNLELWSKMQPRGQSVEDKIDFAIKILSIYRPSMLIDSM